VVSRVYLYEPSGFRAGLTSLLALVKIRAQASDLGNAAGAPERFSKELDPGVHAAATDFTL
jgi:hypothetical protein